jgi:spermidine/putrescine transport system substrate-binding protein
MVAKLQAGASGYDIIVPSNYIVPVVVATGLASTIVRKYVPNLANLAPTFVNPVFDPGNEHAIPYQWGTSGYAWRTDKVPGSPDSWAIFLDSKYKGKMTQMDDMRDVIGAWLRYRGKSLNSIDPVELAQAKKDALAAKKNLKAYISAPVKGQLISGDVWVAQLWNGDTAQAKVEQPNIGYVVPKEGCTIWTDSMMITSSAPHRRAAHEFINYVLRPDVGAAISNTTGYGSPNEAALARMKTPVPYPTAEEFQRLEYQKDLGEAGTLWDQIWTEIKSG